MKAIIEDTQKQIPTNIRILISLFIYYPYVHETAKAAVYLAEDKENDYRINEAFDLICSSKHLYLYMKDWQLTGLEMLALLKRYIVNNSFDPIRLN